LTGRNADRLGVVAADAATAGAICKQGLIDLRDRAALSQFLADFDAAHPIDLLIANAGILDGRHADGAIENEETTRRVIEINLLGSLDTLHALLPAMRARHRGHIVLVSSLAGLSPLPDAPAYSASKAGLLSYGLAMRAAVAAENVQISVVCPGYVASAMTETHIGEQPMKMSAAKAAGLIAAGIARNKPMIGFPMALYWLSRISPLIPEAINRIATKGIRFHVAPRE
jgi:short-subunit dehydrogenase